MTRAIDLIVRFSRAATGAAFAVLMGAVLVQVLGRAGLFSPQVWTEELTRFALLYLAAFGAGLSFRTGDLVNVEIVSESLPGRWPRRLRFLGAVLTAAMCALLIGPAWKYTSIGAIQTSPALGWRMDFIHVSVLLLIVSLAVFALASAVSMALGLSDGLPDNRLEDMPQ